MADARKVLVGLEILSRYAEPAKVDARAEHDTIICDGLPPERVAPGHLAKMADAGWRYDTAAGHWVIST